MKWYVYTISTARKGALTDLGDAQVAVHEEEVEVLHQVAPVLGHLALAQVEHGHDQVVAQRRRRVHAVNCQQSTPIKLTHTTYIYVITSTQMYTMYRLHIPTCK